MYNTYAQAGATVGSKKKTETDINYIQPSLHTQTSHIHLHSYNLSDLIISPTISRLLSDPIEEIHATQPKSKTKSKTKRRKEIT